ncbi:hypothetical protein BGZ58_000737 [Dissophora ornata]|nr:hypothetical protein BGZ58_000737 [Dissophora ornata]
MSTYAPEEKPLPSVIIIGAGLGGLMLGALLQQINVPYHIFERTKEAKPLGSAMSLGATILPVFEQLGLLEELYKVSLPCPLVDFHDANMKALGTTIAGHTESTGYEYILFARPRLHMLLLKQVPVDKISYSKKMLRTAEKDGKVFAYFSDNTMVEGDILIGADGAYSAVRQSLYKDMDDKGLLPKSDLENLSVGYLSMVGVAEANPEKYPQMNDGRAHFSQVLGKDSRSWGVYNVADNQVCWLLNSQLSEEDAKDQHFRNSEWGPESNEAMLKEYSDLPCPWGGKMSDIFDATPKHLISKVFFEDKLFLTWYNSRTVLIGDGAVNALQDAVILANCIYNMPDASPQSTKTAFEDYYKQRFHHAEEQYKRSVVVTKITFGQDWWFAAGNPYHIFERATEERPLVLQWGLKQTSCLCSNSLDYWKNSILRGSAMEIFNANLNKVGDIAFNTPKSA